MSLINCLSVITLMIGLVLLDGCSSDQNVHVCQGSDKKKAVEIIETAYYEGRRLGLAGGYSGNYVKAMQAGMELAEYLNNQASALPSSCQQLVNSWASLFAASMGNPYAGGGTECAGGVCCDSSGCYD